jgi:hypothetical protein
MTLRRRLSLFGLGLFVALFPALVAPARRARADDVPFTVTTARGDQTAVPGEPVIFTVLAPERGRTYFWSFGDGTRPVFGTRVLRPFRSVDDFTVSLWSLTDAGQELLGARVVRVTPEFGGVVAADSDGQFTPADLFQMAVVVRAPGLARLRVRTGGSLVLPREVQLEPSGQVDWLVMNDMRLVDERNPLVREQIIARPGAALPLADGALTVTLEYVTSAGRPVSLTYAPPVKDFFAPTRTVALTYPRIHAFAGLPPEGTGVDDYYLRGDADFSHTDDAMVRLLALEWGRRGGPWPDDPHEVAMNLFRTIDALLGDGDPGEFNNDYNLARLFEDGTLSKTRRNGQYICIAQAYLFTGLARTLGFPAREVNNAIGEAAGQRADGVWRVKWWQEAGLELWYDDAWHYFDTWLSVTDRRAYLAKNLIYQAWAAFDARTTEFRTVTGAPTGLRGHDFSAWPGDPPQWAFLEEVVRPGVQVEGAVGEPPAVPITRGPALPAAEVLAAR